MVPHSCFGFTDELFEINSATPVMVYRELGGGEIRLMVPARDWMRAQSIRAVQEQQPERAYAMRLWLLRMT